MGVNADMLVYNLSQCGSGQYRLLLAATVDEEVRRAEWSGVEWSGVPGNELLDAAAAAAAADDDDAD